MKQTKALKRLINRKPLEALVYSSLASLALSPIASYIGGYRAEKDRQEKEAGAGTMAASMLIPASALATIGSTIGALSNKENRGKGALVGAGIGGGMGVAGGIPIGRALSKILADKNLPKNFNKKIHDTAESIGKRFGEGTAKGVKKEMDPLSIFRKKKRPAP